MIRLSYHYTIMILGRYRMGNMKEWSIFSRGKTASIVSVLLHVAFAHLSGACTKALASPDFRSYVRTGASSALIHHMWNFLRANLDASKWHGIWFAKGPVSFPPIQEGSDSPPHAILPTIYAHCSVSFTCSTTKISSPLSALISTFLFLCMNSQALPETREVRTRKSTPLPHKILHTTFRSGAVTWAYQPARFRERVRSSRSLLRAS